ncbi:protein alp1-like [Plakobranchus ocellatus]|uniref:Protein alp1-like n=1 Tax=Plakobranchus ocellatus TaxID=259542 RepID=A0AAV4C2W1_9GAST|nr:protein alp1-like [Plakobranchus ocellatus]
MQNFGRNLQMATSQNGISPIVLGPLMVNIFHWLTLLQLQRFYFYSASGCGRCLGRLLVVDIGSYGSCSDDGIFSASCLGKHLCEGSLDNPAAKKIPGTELITPHVFVADEAFALLPNLMKPFTRRQLTTQKRVFNYRLSRARRQIECTFGILSNTWRIIKSIDTDVLPAIDSVKAICVLHNFLLAKEPNRIQVAGQTQTRTIGVLLEILAPVSQDAEILPNSRLQFDRHCATTLILQKAVYRGNSKLVCTRSRAISRHIPYRQFFIFIIIIIIIIRMCTHTASVVVFDATPLHLPASFPCHVRLDTTSISFPCANSNNTAVKMSHLKNKNKLKDKIVTFGVQFTCDFFPQCVNNISIAVSTICFIVQSRPCSDAFN